MLKTKFKVLAAAIAITLSSGAASAAVVADTTDPVLFPTDSAIPLSEEQDSWAAGYFFTDKKINGVNVCSNGCDITGATLLLDITGFPTDTNSSFAGVKLELYSDTGALYAPNMGQPLFTFTSPATVNNVLTGGQLGNFVSFTAVAQDQNPLALLQPNTGYWLRLTNVSQPTQFGWYYDGFDSADQRQVTWTDYGLGLEKYVGTPLIFQVNGVNSLTPPPSNVPLPGAVWMMGSVLLGFTVAGRRKKTD